MSTSVDPNEKPASHTLNSEDYNAIKQILLQWKAEGNEHPMLPSDVDVNGDGLTDAYGLSDTDEVIFVTGAQLSQTVYVSEGDGHDGANVRN